METYTSKKSKMAKKFTPLFQNPGKTHTTAEVYGLKSSENQKNASSKKSAKIKKETAKTVCEGYGVYGIIAIERLGIVAPTIMQAEEGET